MHKYVQFWSRLSFFVLLLALLFPESSVAQRKWFEEVDTVQSQKGSADKAINRVYVSSEYDSTNPLFRPNSDLLATEVKAIQSFLKSNAAPKDKSLYLIRYGVDHQDVFQILVDAQRNVSRIVNITDFNVFLDPGKLPEGQKYSIDYANASRLVGPRSQGFDFLQENGFEIGGQKFGIFSQPLFDQSEDQMIPIMHEKALLLRTKTDGKKADKYRFFMGTNNLTDNRRYNRLWDINEVQLAEHYLAHIEAMEAIFEKNGTIKDTSVDKSSVPKPFRVVYKDQSYIELGFSHGRYNPNDRLTDVLEQANAGKIQVKELILSHFVFTNRPFYDALTQALDTNPFPVLSITDDRFAEQRGWGRAIQLSGYDVFRPFGGVNLGAKTAIQRHVESYVYQRAAVDKDGTRRIEEVQDGPPESRHVWHDKTTYIHVVDENNEEWVYIGSGSFNLSGKSDNAEAQLLFKVKPDSLIATGTRESVVETIKNQRQYALPVDVAVMRNALASFLGRTDLEVPIDDAKEVLETVTSRNFKRLTEILKSIIEIETELTQKVPKSELLARIENLQKFFNWYTTKLDPSGLPERLRYEKVTTLMVALGNANMDDWDRKRALSNLIWRPDISDDYDLRDRLLSMAWKKIKFEGEPPISKKQKEKPRVLPSVRPLMVWMFDWDDNIFRMPTRVVLFKKQTGEEITISTSAYAKERSRIGQSGDYADYEVRPNRQTGSFRYFSESETGNFFLDDIRRAVETMEEAQWQGPAWEEFARVVGDKELNPWIYLNTARDHGKDEIQEGLRYLRESGYLPQPEMDSKEPVLKLNNIFAVGGSTNPAYAKLTHIRNILNNLNSMPIPDGLPDRVGADGKTKAKVHYFGMSDDDYESFRYFQEELQKDIDQGKFGKVKISLFFTGTNHPTEQPKRVVIQRNKKPRFDITEAERDEVSCAPLPDNCQSHFCGM